jgi:hypothetical protein
MGIGINMSNNLNTKNKVYFGFALADSMFSGECNIARTTMSAEQVHYAIKEGVVSCCNPSHIATIKAAKARFGITPAIADTPPQVALQKGDSIIVMGVRGLPRLTDRHEYTTAEIAQAAFAFSKYTVI